MNIIYKYSLEMRDYQEIHIPEDSEIVYLGLQLERPKLWIKHKNSSKNKSIKRIIGIYATGEAIDENEEYIGTFQLANGEVYHVFINNLKNNINDI